MRSSAQPYGSIADELAVVAEFEELGLFRPNAGEGDAFLPTASSSSSSGGCHRHRKNIGSSPSGGVRRRSGWYLALAVAVGLLGGGALLVALGQGFSLGGSGVDDSKSNFALTLKWSTADAGAGAGGDEGGSLTMAGVPTAAPTYGIAQVQVVQRIDYVTYKDAASSEAFKTAFTRGVVSGGKIQASELEFVGVVDTVYGDAVEVTYNVRKTNLQLSELETLVRSSGINAAVKSYLIAAGFKNADTLQSAKTANFSPSQAPTMHPTVVYASIHATQRVDGITLSTVNGNVKFLTAIAAGLADATDSYKEDVGFLGIEDCADGLGVNVEYTLRRHNVSAAVLIGAVQSTETQLAVTTALTDYGFTAALLQEAATVVDLSPSQKPTIRPSSKPSFRPTLEPTALNTPSAAPSQKVLTATVVQAIAGVTVADTVSDAFVATIQSAVSSALSVPAASVLFQGVYPTADKSGVNVEYSVVAPLTNSGHITASLSAEENVAQLTAALRSAGFTSADASPPEATDISPTSAPSFRPGSPTPAPTEYVKCSEYTVVQFLQRFEGINAAEAATAQFQKQVVAGIAAGTGLPEGRVEAVSAKASRYGEAVDFVYLVMGPVDTTADALANLVKGAAVTDTVLENLRNVAGFKAASAAAEAIPTNLCKIPESGGRRRR